MCRSDSIHACVVLTQYVHVTSKHKAVTSRTKWRFAQLLSVHVRVFAGFATAAEIMKVIQRILAGSSSQATVTVTSL
jgi:hypothetical protein